jgi:hypothetical protein
MYHPQIHLKCVSTDTFDIFDDNFADIGERIQTITGRSHSPTQQHINSLI